MLKDEIDSAKKIVTTDRIQISLGEIASMYENGELNVLPEFQRLFRWGPQKKSDFIESLLVGIPIPPAFAYENADATWELIDGLQRISTILEFMGILKDPDDDGVKIEPSKLLATKYLPSLNGVGWYDGGESNNGLGKAYQLFLRRTRIDFQVLKYPSEVSTKFDLFQRLNRGGAYANEQEVRTCSMVLANREFTGGMKEIAASDEFRTIFRISDKNKLDQKDMEYLVRLICHGKYDYTGGQNVEEFLDKKILEIAQSDGIDTLLDDIRETINLLNEIDGENVLRPKDSHGISEGRFTLRSLEVIAVGVLRNISSIHRLPDSSAFVREKIDSFWSDRETVDRLGGAGQRGTTRWGLTIPFGDQWFKPV